MKEKKESKFKVEESLEENEVSLHRFSDGFEVRVNGDQLMKIRDNGALTLFAAWYRKDGVLD